MLHIDPSGLRIIGLQSPQSTTPRNATLLFEAVLAFLRAAARCHTRVWLTRPTAGGSTRPSGPVLLLLPRSTFRGHSTSSSIGKSVRRVRDKEWERSPRASGDPALGRRQDDSLLQSLRRRSMLQFTRRSQNSSWPRRKVASDSRLMVAKDMVPCVCLQPKTKAKHTAPHHGRGGAHSTSPKTQEHHP